MFSGCLIGCAGGKGGDGLAAGMVYGEAPDAPPFQSRIKIVAERVSAVLRSAIVVVAVFAEICPQGAAVGFRQAAQAVGRLVERAIKADEPVLRVKFGLGVVAAGAQAGGGLDKADVQRCAAGGLGVETERRQRVLCGGAADFCALSVVLRGGEPLGVVLRDAGGLGIVFGLQDLCEQGGKRGGVVGFGVAVGGGLPYAETEYDACAIEFGAQGDLAVGVGKVGFGKGHFGLSGCFWAAGGKQVFRLPASHSVSYCPLFASAVTRVSWQVVLGSGMMMYSISTKAIGPAM